MEIKYIFNNDYLTHCLNHIEYWFIDTESGMKEARARSELAV